MRLPSHRGSWGLACCVLLAACPGDDMNTGSATGTTTTTTGASTDDGTTSAAPTTSTGAPTSSGTTGEPTTGAPTTGTTGGGGGAMADCEAQYAELAKQSEKDCMCLVTDGSFPDQQTCLDDLGQEPAGCICPIVAGDPENAAFLACVAAAEQDFTICAAGLACDDVDGFFACLDAYDDAFAPCGAPSKQSNGQIELACYDLTPFMCTSGGSIPDYYTCDDEPDCMDMSDESEATCMFTCMDGQKIPKFEVCNGAPECMDGSDELDETCKFTCMDGETIPKDYVCDGEPDCMDGSDEAICLMP